MIVFDSVKQGWRVVFNHIDRNGNTFVESGTFERWAHPELKTSAMLVHITETGKYTVVARADVLMCEDRRPFDLIVLGEQMNTLAGL